ncbi:MAG: hypothetical protein HRU25_11095 [Psychrobium sp.]|nr:hypothetical protein [Psychrobium sp.]
MIHFTIGAYLHDLAREHYRLDYRIAHQKINKPADCHQHTKLKNLNMLLDQAFAVKME